MLFLSGFKGSKVQRFKGSKVQRFRGSEVQRFGASLSAPTPQARVLSSGIVSLRIPALKSPIGGSLKGYPALQKIVKNPRGLP